MITKNKMYINFLKIKNGNIHSLTQGYRKGYRPKRKNISLYQYNKTKKLLKNNEYMYIIEHKTKLSKHVINNIKKGEYDFMITGDNNE